MSRSAFRLSSSSGHGSRTSGSSGTPSPPRHRADRPRAGERRGDGRDHERTIGVPDGEPSRHTAWNAPPVVTADAVTLSRMNGELYGSGTTPISPTSWEASTTA